ncbi:8-oxo-dGTP pyrophosphatase MutT (NUDIX family) [Neomicrococcus aestuarii]|uniref:8-oxo-dGTP pyrophosphatase MutT (NUDIX family) n=2 Tax=Neomicrococcus aestuarii TaxID=556325 RepID=A0A7W8TWH7_9MICC|nr:NUDIX hydrolase [Neomicrococcus aestuarii]MBB5513313.1 8-oxo-dGTP pyrophosphatase MutT (NUDIX family) [Neomicrococcus aestuarii]
MSASPAGEMSHPATAPIAIAPEKNDPTGVVRRLFPISPQQREAAAQWMSIPDRTPRATRRASSVVLVKDSRVGVQTWLGYRGPDSPLGQVAFPGGSFEANDDAAYVWHGPSVGEWAKKMSIDDHRLAKMWVVCAIRELFEETGVLLAGPDSLSTAEIRGGELRETRQAVATQDLSFSEVLARRGWGLRTDLLRPLSRWISPDFMHRRFDTRFFVAVVPPGQSPSLLEGKSQWGEWVVAKDIIEQRATSSLGDHVAEAISVLGGSSSTQAETVGRPLSHLTTPAVEAILEKISSTRGCVAYLSCTRNLKTYTPELVKVGGEYLLDIATANAPEGGAIARGR